MHLGLPVSASIALVLLAAPALAATRKVPSEDYPAIQAAINASDDGDKIVVAPGTYETGFSIGEISGLTIRFQPGAVLQGGTIEIFYADDVTLIGITMQSPSSGGAALYATHAHGLTITGLTITGGVADGIQVDESTGVRIRKTTVEDCVGDGLDTLDCADLVVDRCTFDGNGGWGILLGGDGSEVRVLRNRVVADGFGISVYGTDVRIEKNTVEGPSEKGISAAGGTLIVVQKNIVTMTDGLGVEVSGEAPLVAKNTLLGFSDDGIRVLGVESRVEKNKVTGATRGIFTASAGVAVSKNTVTGSSAWAFWTDGTQATVSRNRAVDTGATAFLFFSSGATVTGNVADGANWGFFFAIGAVLTRNTAIGCTTDLGSNASEGAFTLTKNKFLTFVYDYNPDPV